MIGANTIVEVTRSRTDMARTVAEVALCQPKPVTVLTSDSDDMARLCGDHVRVIPL